MHVHSHATHGRTVARTRARMHYRTHWNTHHEQARYEHGAFSMLDELQRLMYTLLIGDNPRSARKSLLPSRQFCRLGCPCARGAHRTSIGSKSSISTMYVFGFCLPMPEKSTCVSLISTCEARSRWTSDRAKAWVLTSVRVMLRAEELSIHCLQLRPRAYAHH
eukprot:6079238-Pleurochrysis_carterae.AAC.1